MQFPLSGDRVELRPFVAADGAAMHGIYSDERVMRWVGAGPVGDLRQTQAMLGDYIAHQRAHGFSFWAVVERSAGAVIGDAGLYHHGDDVELGYTLAHCRWGRGYGTEAAGLCVRAAFAELGMSALVAVTRPENHASIGVLGKLGFRRSGVTTAYAAEHWIYRLTSHLSSRGGERGLVWRV